MVERIRTALRAAGDEIRDFLERAYAPEEPGRFHLALAGLTREGERAGLSASCLALRIARRLGLWEQVDKDEQAAWIAFVGSFQGSGEGGGSAALAAAFLDPEVAAAARSGEGRLARWTRNWAGDGDPLVDLARASTRCAVSALACVDAYPRTPYRALPTDPQRLGAELRRWDWSVPAAAAERSADLIALVMSQGRQFLELTELHLLREAAGAWFEGLADAQTGSFFSDAAPPRAQLVATAAHVLDALDWIGRPVPHPTALIDTCLALDPGRDCDLADWARVVHYSLRQTDHRREELQTLAPAVLEQIWMHRQSDGGWSLRLGAMATHDGPLQISDGRPGGDLFGTERFTDAAALLMQLLEWEEPRWAVLRR
jgi:hypothetical protein